VILLAVDPSIVKPGIALFVRRELRAVAKVKIPAVHERAGRAAIASYALLDWYSARVAEGLLAGCDGSFIELAVEWPRVLPYGAAGATGQPNDLFGLAGVCAGFAVALRPHRVHSYLPDEWCKLGKVSPERKRAKLGPIDSEAFTSPKGARIMSRLTPAERALVPQSHDAVDAVGIGLHALGRLAPVKVYPGAVP
jgi:hypothetical protein